MTLIYSDSIIIDREWVPVIDFGDAVEVTHSLDDFERASHPRKIALTAHRLHVDHDAEVDFTFKVRRLSACAAVVFCIESELHNFHWSIWSTCHRENVYWLVPGAVNDRPSMADHVIFWGDWFKTTANLYKKLPDKVQELRPYEVKPRYFDALLGSPKPHRQFVAEQIQQHGLQNQVVMTYGGRWQQDSFYAQDYFIWEPGCTPMQPIIGTADWVDYHGQQAHLSQVMPITVYNDCAYSIVAETDHDNTLSFFSEKTAKALIARRLFVAFTGYKFLHNLRQIGFHTFNNVIDESYDDIPHDATRYQQAFLQVKALCGRDQAEVLSAVRETVDHNHDLIMHQDWNDRSRQEIQHIISAKAVCAV